MFSMKSSPSSFLDLTAMELSMIRKIKAIMSELIHEKNLTRNNHHSFRTIKHTGP